MKLIAEITEDIEVLTESAPDGSKSYYIEGIFLQGNLKNRNNRVYSMDILDEEVQRYNNEFVDQNRAFGELGHPDSATINLERASHMIKVLQKNGNDFYGKAKIMDTPYGKIVKSLIDEGAKLGVSSRGLGSMEERGGVNYVNKDFHLATAADIVADPSAPDAFVRGIMEDAEWMFVDGRGWIRQHVADTKKQMQKMNKEEREATALRAFQRILREF